MYHNRLIKAPKHNNNITSHYYTYFITDNKSQKQKEPLYERKNFVQRLPAPCVGFSLLSTAAAQFDIVQDELCRCFQ